MLQIALSTCSTVLRWAGVLLFVLYLVVPVVAFAVAGS
jgi:hypothetical protein